MPLIILHPKANSRDSVQNLMETFKEFTKPNNIMIGFDPKDTE